ncbi:MULTISPECIES: nuclear transport factor 2 family protein [unclassified Novosphingobium]|uniref:nuclear transport factor 2 family protein n=1 Tax=unclassified Novosphingobium TaxID=2644732 RepID=UPI0025EACF10|nr:MULTISPECIES: nuclear transport factor 2 family protein [unclassified Novosphingobium]HQV04516.1 nuclear transport factor 2 family protein [Novosphingobium sp.]
MRSTIIAVKTIAAAFTLSLTSVSVAQLPDRDGAAAVLASYKAAIERLDMTGVDSLFAPDAVVIESGKVEGTFAKYLDHHLGPELKEFKSFSFQDYRVEIRVEGPIAIATETYTYRIVLKNEEVVERLGVASSVLKWNGQAWQIVSTHSSSRKPKAAVR